MQESDNTSAGGGSDRVAAAWPLDGCTVLDLSTGLAGAYCTKLLADGGARVVCVEPPGGDPLRRWSESGAAIGADEDGALFQFLSTSKHSIVASTDLDDVAFVRWVADTADIVVWSSGSPLADHPDLLPSALHAILPSAVVVALSPFGLDGPWNDRPSTDFTLQALAGSHVNRGLADRPPLICGGRPGDWAAGTFAAIGALASLRRAITHGVGDLVDVAVLDSLLLGQNLFPVTFNEMAGRPFRAKRMGAVPNIHPTQDGFVCFYVTTGQQWLDFCVLIERIDWQEDEQLGRMENRAVRHDELMTIIDKWTSGRTTTDIVELAEMLRIPAAEVGNGASVPTLAHFRERSFFTTNPGGGFVQPGVAYTLGGGAACRPFEPSPKLGQHTDEYRAASADSARGTRRVEGIEAPLPFAGMRVVDLTAYWAGPIIGHMLSLFGAEVIHVESAKRPDGIRMASAKPLTEPQWWEWSAFFQSTNTNKLDLAIDLDNDRGRSLLLELIASSDVVIDNYSPRVLENWGMGQDELLERDPKLIVLRAPAYGLTGPWRERVAYAPTIEAVSGLAWVTGFPDGRPEPAMGIADSMGGAHALVGLLLALEHRRRTGRGMLLECPMVGGSLNIAAEQVVEYSAYGQLLEREGNSSRWRVPQGMYLSSDVDAAGARDQWVAVSVETDEQWTALCRAIGEVSWVDDPSFATLEGRRTERLRIDEHIEAWCGARSQADVVRLLSDAGVPAEPALPAHRHNELDQVVWRKLFEKVEHPVTGAHDFIGFPFRFANGPVVHHRRHAPLLGEHNAQVLADILGLSEVEILALQADGVIGNQAGGGHLW